MQNPTQASLRAALALRMLTALPLAVPAAAMLVAPIVISTHAEARPGSGSSFGSRGSRSFSPPPSVSIAPRGATPFNRPAPMNPGFNPGYRPYGGFGSRPLLHGFMGGLLGAGLFGLLSGHGFFGGGFGLLSMLGTIIQLALLFLIARWVFRRFFTRQAAGAGAPRGMAFGGNPVAGGAMAGGASTAPLTLQPQDFQSFESLLMQIQSAWSRGDLGALRQYTTPEMAANFNAQLSDLARRGLRNQVSDVRLEKGEQSEAWSEPGAQYATVAMRYSLLDVTTDTAGRVVDGNPGVRDLVTEYWTFTRRPGGPWALSAIQQTG